MLANSCNFNFLTIIVNKFRKSPHIRICVISDYYFYFSSKSNWLLFWINANTNLKLISRQKPISMSNWLYDIFWQGPNGIAKSIHYFVKRLENFIAKAMNTNPGPNLLNGVHFRGVRRQWDNLNILRHDKPICGMPCRPVRYKNDIIVCVRFWKLAQKDSHANGIAIRQN